MNTYEVCLNEHVTMYINSEYVKVYPNKDIMFYNTHSKFLTKEVIAFYQVNEYKWFRQNKPMLKM